MSKSVLVNFGNSAVNDNNTLAGGGYSLSGSLKHNNEAISESPIRYPGVFSNLFVYVSANTTSTVSSTFTLRKSRAATSVSIVYAAGETGIKEDTTNTSSYADTDEVNCELIVPNDTGTTTITSRVLGVQFEPTDKEKTISLFINRAGTFNFSTASVTRYTSPTKDWALLGTSEAAEKYRCRFPFASKNLWVNINSNARTTDTVFKTRKNGADGAQTLTFAAGESGSKEDTTNTDSLSIGDDFNYALTSGTGTELMTPRQMTTTALSLDNSFPLLCAGVTSISFNTTTYAGLSGDLTQVTTTEASTQFRPMFNFTVKELGTYVSSNTIATSPSSITLRGDSADTSLTVSYTAGQTGLKSDTTNSFEAVGGISLLNYKITTPNTSGTLNLNWVGVLGQTRFNRSPTGSVAYSSAAGFQF